MNSHQISRTVLKRFCNKDQVLFVNKKDGTKTLVKPLDTAFVKIPEIIISELEKEWGQGLENDFEKVYKALVRGDFFASVHLKRKLKGIIALHYVRSFHSLRLLDKIGKEKVQEIMIEAKNINPTMSDEEYDKNFRAIYAQMFSDVYIESLKTLIPKVKDFLEDKNFEIGYTHRYTKFIISDIPVLGITEDHKLAARDGVALMDCTGIAMPISPNYLVSFTTESEKKERVFLTNNQVRNANNKSIAQSIVGYYEFPRDNS